jgi:hypothetical protein
MIPTVKNFIIDNTSTTKMYTRFQVEQLLIKYGRLVVDECAENIYMTNSAPNEKVSKYEAYMDMENEEVFPTLNIQKVKNQIR